ncbi:unnamed protein product [Penicillium roqueforti FM164]|uniref:Genomic scaffold, ProqFM164S01 n=1 Tax=Penicillium roqueforti (strain FM164) TaxID=1365484 RepID=W6PQE6_PENRF|nr:unnamed protein product [Penicillium roqueforti FM164]
MSLKKIVGMYPSMYLTSKKSTSLHAISYSMVQCAISGVVVLASRDQMRDFFCSHSKDYTTAHRYMVGGANI